MGADHSYKSTSEAVFWNDIIYFLQTCIASMLWKTSEGNYLHTCTKQLPYSVFYKGNFLINWTQFVNFFLQVLLFRAYSMRFIFLKIFIMKCYITVHSWNISPQKLPAMWYTIQTLWGVPWDSLLTLEHTIIMVYSGNWLWAF